MTRVLSLLPFALLASACASTKPPATVDPQPVAQEGLSGEGSSARPAVEPSCRALVNFDDGTFLDVEVEDGKVHATRKTGTALYDQAAVYLAVVEPRGGEDWTGADLVRVGPDGKTELWSSNDPGERPSREEFCDTDPDDPDAEEECWMDPEDFYAEHSIEIVGAFGPYLSIASMGYGFAGGAHEYDDGVYETLGLPGVQTIEGKLLGAPHVALARRVMAEEIIDEEMTEDMLPTFDSPEDFGEFAVRLGPGDAFNISTTAEALAGEEPEDLDVRPHMMLRMEAGSWAANHGYIELALDLTPVPDALASYMPDRGRWMGPNDCAMVSIPDAAVLIPDGDGWAPAHELNSAIIGVTWIAPEQGRVPGLDDLRG